MHLHIPSLAFSVLLIVLLIGVALYQGMTGFDYNSNETTNLWLRLSHASAAVLLVLLAVIWLPVLNNLLTRLRASRWARYQIMDQKRLHRWLGYLLLMFTLAHGGSQLLYLTTLELPFAEALIGREPDLVRAMRSTMYEFVTEDESIEVIEQWIANGRTEAQFHADVRPILKDDCTKCHSESSTQTYAIPALPLVSWQDTVALSQSGLASRQFRINISGLLLFSFFVLMSIVALPPLRQRMYHCFQQLHRLGYWMLPLLILHIPQWYWLLPAMLLLGWDRWQMHNSTHAVQAATLGWLDRTTVCLTLRWPQSGQVRAGDYVQIKVPAVSRWEWHPFSIAVSQDDRLMLKINVSGDWTTRLTRYADVCPLYVQVRGPYPSPATLAVHSGRRVLVAGGIGITPYWQWLEAGLCERTTLIWVISHPERLAWLRPVAPLIRGQLEVYVTEPTTRLPDWIQMQPRLNVSIGRPCWEQLSIQLTASGAGDCYVCGPDSLMADASRSFRLRNWHVFRESF